jgi:hypothetical protein
MRIPEVANGMRKIAEEIQEAYPTQAAELLELAGELRRRSGETRAPATSTPMTPELYEEIKEYAADNPGMSRQAIAEVFDVNIGRVSEAIIGKRT